MSAPDFVVAFDRPVPVDVVVALLDGLADHFPDAETAQIPGPLPGPSFAIHLNRPTEEHPDHG